MKSESCDRASQFARIRSKAGKSALLFGLVSLTACGNVTSGGFGELEVVLSSDEVIDLQATVLESLQSTVLETELSGGPARAGGDEIEGTVTVRVRSFARRAERDFEELTDGAQEVTVSIQDPEPVEIARRRVSAGRYDGVLTVFHRVEAEITSGLVVDGVPVEGTVSIDLGATETLSVVTLTGFDVWEDTPTLIALEMQSRLWLRLVNAAARSVDRTDFRRIFRIRVRTGLAG